MQKTGAMAEPTVAMTRKLYARAKPLANTSVSVGRTFGAAAKQLLHGNAYSVGSVGSYLPSESVHLL